MNQTGIRSGRLSKWTKELNFDGVEGNDAVALLERAVADAADAFPVLRRLTVGALANDTVGVLAAGAYLDPRCDMGLICRHRHQHGRRHADVHDGADTCRPLGADLARW